MRELRRAIGAYILLLPCIGIGQTRQQPQIPQFDASAVVKLVAVRVLDSAGRPVAGLKKEDFRLTDNGKSQTITEFEVHAIDLINPHLDKIPGSQVSKTGETNRKFFLLFDIQGSDEIGMANAKKAAHHFIETQLLPTDEVGVLSFAPMTGLSMKEYLTSDMDKIRKAIDRAKEAPPSPGFIGGTEVMEDQKAIISEVREKQLARKTEGEVVGQEMNGGDVYNIVPVPPLKTYARQPQDYNAALTATANVLNYIPRPVYIILFSARLIPIYLARSFATANIPVFVVQTQNWKTESVISVPIKKKYIWEDHPLKEFALATGGQYYANIEALKSIAEGIQSFSSEYYVLGYYINASWEGRYHKIHVTVDRTDFRVYAQDGYSEPRPFAQWSEIEKKIQLYEMIYGDELMLGRFESLAVDVLQVQGREGRAYLIAGVPINEKNGVPPGKTELHAIVFDEKGGIEASAQSEADFAGQQEHTKNVYVTAALAAGEHEFRFITRNTITGQAAVGRIVFKAIGPMAGISEGLRLATPLLYVPGNNAEYLNMSAPARKSVKPPSIGDFYPVIPKGYVPILGSLPRGTKTLIAVFPVEKILNPVLDLRMKAELNLRGGENVIILEHRSIEINNIHPTRNAYVYELSLPELAAGDYTLRITVWEKDGDPRAVIEKYLAIRN